jgi:ATP-dependent exoDNAse (exonuclease V) beta subunit
VDKKGNSYIFDYKTSPKTYNKYNSNKKLDFDYQLAFYRNMLKTYGFTVSDNN